ncbi:MAG: PH domain-containing protein [Xanthomonadales bacterium]|jgi:putative membrane protein|nr:PH domain-containing protein [Xanthomonadales bacterium]
MSAETVIREASFDPKVKTYWLLSGAVVFVITIIGIPLLLLWFPLGFIFTGRYLDRMSCTLTSKSLKVRKGVLVRVEKTIPLEKITDMALVQGPIMRAMDIHRLTVETAGQSGAGALVSLTGIVMAEDFREAVLAQRDAMAEPRKSTEGRESTTAEGKSAELAELRDSVLRIERLLESRLAPKD